MTSAPEMQRFSPRNLKYMRAFAEAHPDESFVQQLAAQILWLHHCLLLDKIKDCKHRELYSSYRLTTKLPEELVKELPAPQDLERVIEDAS